jgi:hypothetical protein
MAQKSRVVNDILNRLGKSDQAQNSTTDSGESTIEGPGGTSTASHVERILNNKIDIISAEGWYWNQKWDIDVVLDVNNKAEVGRLETMATIGTGASAANPCAITTSAAHNLETGDRIYVTNVVGMTQLNDRYFTVTKESDVLFSLDGEDSTTHTTYASAGTITPLRKIYHIDTWGGSGNIPVVRRGDYLYDLDDNKDTHGGNLKVTYIYETAFGEIPQPFIEYLTACTAFYFNRSFINNTNADQGLRMEMESSDASMRRAENSQVDVNLLNTYEAHAIRGRSRYTTRRTSPQWH